MFRRLLPILIVSLVALPLVAAPQGKTLDNLQAAFNGESNAHARYLAFAEKAKAEGYGEVASLFRAAARAEEVHAATHAAVITKLGAKPKATIETPVVKTTKENLVTAEKGEIYERDVMYPEFIKIARAEKQSGALRSFNFAKTAEAEHASLYADASKNADSMKGASATYYVCSVCGYTTKSIDNLKKCPSCFNPKEKYVAVS